MYPVIDADYQIRGTSATPYLVSCKENKTIPLEDMLLVELLKNCTGTVSLNNLAKRLKIATEDLKSFLGQFQNVGVIKLLASPQAREVVVSLANSKPWLKEVHLDVTGKCNLAKYCKHCFRGKMLNTYTDRSLEEWLEVVEKLSAFGVYCITISGGEPFLRKDLYTIIKKILAEGMLLNAIFTNGTILNDKVRRVVNLLVGAGIHNSYYISLDGPTAEIHDLNRGKGSFCKTMEFIAWLLRVKQETNAPFEVVVNSQVNIYTYKLLTPWFKMLQNLGVSRWRLTSGRVTGNLLINSHLVPPYNQLFEEYRSFIDFYLQEYREGRITTKINLESFFTSRMLDEKKALTFDESIPICDYKENACSIEPNGDVQFCTSWGGKSFGNVFEQNIKEIWTGAELQMLKQFKIGNISSCKGCELLCFCGGGCRLVAKDLYSKDEYSCLKYKLFASRILPLLRDEGIKFATK
ncbi:hypothetical protein A2165_01535 [Candidatus Curtissbacteria bacterium RBG_13_40_7]|uniref:Radical SAM core domain-containing protein n=1 Tax=Candidatus Curtissbacteria bacterium RBG_13_40_7 TaxID=1797706 RepID=A0A1F5FTS3_9BACT|nr:MAG: hypothetical protein A2165_01535 [Candidatus Curtissbacteria bacterium RBG_13_40_7]